MTVPRPLTEAQWQKRVIATAHQYGWLVHHGRPARTKDGWVTPIEGDPGFLDLVLARDHVVIIPELKTDTGRFQPGQPEWLAALGPYGKGVATEGLACGVGRAQCTAVTAARTAGWESG